MDEIKSLREQSLMYHHGYDCNIDAVAKRKPKNFQA